MILITGANGQLGYALTQLIDNAIATTKQQLDITDHTAVTKFVAKNNIDTIINCAAYTAVDHAEDNEELATQINATALNNLAATNAKIIHISTDYVFSGDNTKPYTETDLTHPNTIYGKTKLAGEKILLEQAKTAIIIRTSWLYGEHGNNFVKTILKHSKKNNGLKVVADQIGSPTNAQDLATAIANIHKKILVGEKQIYHYANRGHCSWYDFAKEIINLANIDCPINAIGTAEYATKALRPKYSVLCSNKIQKDFNLEIPHWRDSLRGHFNKIISTVEE